MKTDIFESNFKNLIQMEIDFLDALASLAFKMSVSE